MYFRNYRQQKTCLSKCIKSHTSTQPGTVSMLNGLKHCSNLLDGSFIRYFRHSERGSVRKCLS